MNPLLSLTPEQLQHFFVEALPHNRALGMRVIECTAGRLSFELPYSDFLVGDPATGEVHEGAITTLIDTVCGSVVLIHQDEPRRTATLDLRVDFLRKSRPGSSIRCDAECLRTGSHLALVRALAHEGDATDPLAIATGTFAVFGRRPAPAGTP